MTEGIIRKSLNSWRKFSVLFVNFVWYILVFSIFYRFSIHFLQRFCYVPLFYHVRSDEEYRILLVCGPQCLSKRVGTLPYYIVNLGKKYSVDYTKKITIISADESLVITFYNNESTKYKQQDAKQQSYCLICLVI